MSLVELSSKDFSQQLASKAAVPGGGGASALAGAWAAALGSMVGSLTLGKKKYEAVQDDIRSLMDRAEELRQQLLSCVDEDAAAFEPLSKAYAIAKDDPSREAIMEAALKEAASVPLKIVRLCCQSMELLDGFGQMGSALAISDAATGAAIAKGALYGGAVNVFVNTSLMKDRAYAAEIEGEVRSCMERYGELADKIYDRVMEKLSRNE